VQALILGGGIADLMVGLIVLEALALSLLRPAALRRALPSLCAGACLALALRCALTGAPWPLLALCLAAAGTAHMVDVVRRWRMSGAPGVPDVPGVPMRGL
jgi:hypothetical protein